MLDQDDNFYLISLSILITCMLDGLWIFWGEVTCQSLLGVKGLRTGNDFLRTYPYVHKLAVYWQKPNVNFFLIFLFSCVVKLNFFSCGIYFISLEGPQLSWDVDITIHSLKQICWWLWIYENHICELWFYEMNMKAISAVQCSIKFSKNQLNDQLPVVC